MKCYWLLKQVVRKQAFIYHLALRGWWIYIIRINIYYVWVGHVARMEI
jgi:hypothetical protein